MSYIVALLCMLAQISCPRVPVTPVPVVVPPREPLLTTYPVHPIQGDPLLVILDRADQNAAHGFASFGRATTTLFSYQGKIEALFGIDLSAATGTYPISVTFGSGEIATTTVTVFERAKIELPLGIPQKLGGNTQASQERVVSDLASENRSISLAPTSPRPLWSEPFRRALSSSTVTDAYGYVRITGPYKIAHKGTDYRAAPGTPVYAMDRGIVRIARFYRVYGNSILIDHGLGLQTLYLHLSKMDVLVGAMVEAGQVIGLSGSTGYADRPHLHVSVHIGKISVDPEAFISLLGK